MKRRSLTVRLNKQKNIRQTKRNIEKKTVNALKVGENMNKYYEERKMNALLGMNVG